jgi:hypothetical protein
MTDQLKIGERQFALPKFPIWAQRKVTPAMMAIAKPAVIDNMDDPKKFGQVIDAIFLALTTNTIDGKPSGDRLNTITKDDFECLSIDALDLAQTVIPAVLVALGLAKAKNPVAPYKPNGGAGDAEPGTPLNGSDTSTTSSPPASSDSNSIGQASNS